MLARHNRTTEGKKNNQSRIAQTPGAYKYPIERTAGLCGVAVAGGGAAVVVVRDVPDALGAPALLI